MDQSSIISLCNVYNAYKMTVYISVEKVDPFLNGSITASFWMPRKKAERYRSVDGRGAAERDEGNGTG